MTYALGGEAEHYQPPDDGPECLWCDGSAMVEVATIVDVGETSAHLWAGQGAT